MNQRALSMHLESTQSTQRALRIREKETNHDFIIPSEPKIFRLVIMHVNPVQFVGIASTLLDVSFTRL